MVTEPAWRTKWMEKLVFWRPASEFSDWDRHIRAR
jgi:hypothetical protein